jgi:hypothetical protein
MDYSLLFAIEKKKNNLFTSYSLYTNASSKVQKKVQRSTNLERSTNLLRGTNLADMSKNNESFVSRGNNSGSINSLTSKH